MNEEWVKIKNFPDYMISNRGNILSFKRDKPRKLGKHINDNGYYFVILTKNKKKYNKKIHCLVAESFISDRPNGLVINHIDSNKINNNFSNLEYSSKSYNTSHYYNSLGKGNKKISVDDIKSIFKRINSGDLIVSISKEYNIPARDIGVLYRTINI